MEKHDPESDEQQPVWEGVCENESSRRWAQNKQRTGGGAGGAWSYHFPAGSAARGKQQVYAQGKELKAEEILKLTELYDSINKPCSLSMMRNQTARFLLLTLFALPVGSPARKHLRFDCVSRKKPEQVHCRSCLQSSGGHTLNNNGVY